MHSFLSTVHQGKNRWHTYGWVMLAIIGYWYFLAGYTVEFYQRFLHLVFPAHPLNGFIAGHLPFLVIVAILAFAMANGHQRRFQSLIHADAKLRMRRFWQGLMVWGMINLAFTGGNIFLYPQSYEFKFEPTQWFLLLFWSLLLIPIQTSAEEIFYRGYLMQGLSLLTKNKFV
jgi:membrane protease YdiL (CAAX protease family)